jgi:hypothetical protein
MGIKNYLKELKQENITIHRNYDIFIIDCNYLIHYLIYNCTNDDELKSKTNNFIKYLFDWVTIKKQLHLVFDGEYDKIYDTNPKLETQNKRMQNVNNESYDKQEISPKSRIIQFFKDSLIKTVGSYISPFKQQFSVIVNDDYVDGEADIKIMNIIGGKTKDGDGGGVGGGDEDSDRICILSKDTDMILIGYNILLNKTNSCKFIDVLCNLRPLKIVNVNRLVKKYAIFGSDYLLLLLLMGNDYLPCIGQVNYKKLINTYKNDFIYIPHQSQKHLLLPKAPTVPFITKDDIIGKRIIEKNKVNYESLILFITCYIINTKCKFNHDNITIDRFRDYYNNLIWCLRYYNIINCKSINECTSIIDYTSNKDGCQYIQLESLSKVINAYNFLYSNNL